VAARKQPAGKERAGNTVDLTESEEQAVLERSGLRAEVVFESVLREGRDELERAPLALAFSGLSAGLSMGFSLLFMGFIANALPDAPWRPLAVTFGYTIGFVIVILGRQQLFTENTITAVIPLLDANDRTGVFGKAARLWGIVLATNLIGAALVALALAHAPVVEPAVGAAMRQIGLAAAAPDMPTLFVRAIFAGWLLALLVWLLPDAREMKVLVIVLISYVVGLLGFSHAIAGSVEVFYAVFTGAVPPIAYLHFAVPTILGNAIGGVILVSLLGYGQVAPKGEAASAPSGSVKPKRTERGGP
jgi:formate/nitrite transporter FocA (FNT family)